MSARDSESGSSTYKGGSGRAGGLGNGGIGGGMGGGGNYGGGMGGGAGRNGGIGNRTGLTTGNRMYGGMAFGRPGGLALNPGAWGVHPTPAIAQGPLAGRTKKGAVTAVPASIPGVNPVPEDIPPPQPSVIGYLPGWPGTGMWWGNQPTYMNNSGLNPPAAPAPAPAPAPSVPKYQDRVPQDPTFPGNTYHGWGTGGVGVADPSRGWGGWNSGWN